MPSATDSPQPSGRAQIDERQVARAARSAALACYGVTGVVGTRWIERVATRLGRRNAGIRVTVAPQLEVSLTVALAPGLPRDTILANVAEAVRYTVRRDAGRPIDHLTLNVAGR